MKANLLILGLVVALVSPGAAGGAAGPAATGRSGIGCSPLVLLDSDFETGAQGWSHVPAGGADTWHRAATTCYGVALPSTMFVSNGNRGADCLVDSTVERSRILGPPITLPSSSLLRLSFDALSFDEGGTCTTKPEPFFDSKDVGITTDGGATYTVLNDCFDLTPGEGTLVHHEFDLGAWAGQTVQTIFVYDTVDDFEGDTFAVDNVTIVTSEQVDGDGDGAGDACDCAPLDPTTWETPGEVHDLRLSRLVGASRLDWVPPTGGTPAALLYDTIRSSSAADFAGAATCLESDDSGDTTSSDPAIPASAGVFFYVVRAENDCGVGSAGNASSGVPRVTRSCP